MTRRIGNVLMVSVGVKKNAAVMKSARFCVDLSARVWVCVCGRAQQASEG